MDLNKSQKLAIENIKCFIINDEAYYSEKDFANAFNITPYKRKKMFKEEKVQYSDANKMIVRTLEECCDVLATLNIDESIQSFVRHEFNRKKEEVVKGLEEEGISSKVHEYSIIPADSIEHIDYKDIRYIKDNDKYYLCVWDILNNIESSALKFTFINNYCYKHDYFLVEFENVIMPMHFIQLDELFMRLELFNKIYACRVKNCYFYTRSKLEALKN